MIRRFTLRPGRISLDAAGGDSGRDDAVEVVSPTVTHPTRRNGQRVNLPDLLFSLGHPA